jgi:hypothetical protein
MNRLYFDKDVSELEAVVERVWGDSERLASVLIELKQRTTRAAARLQRQVEARLDEIRSARQKSSSRGGPWTDAAAAGLQAKLRDAGSQTRAPEGLAHSKARAEEAQTKPSQMAPTQALYARVGLSPDCPDFVLNAVRRAVLREHHPDRYSSPVDKRRAEERFRQIDKVFDQIAALRR